MATILSVSISKEKGILKDAVPRGRLVEDHGLEGDAHAGSVRPVSLLPLASIQKVEGDLKRRGIRVRPGLFAENFVVEGLVAGDVKPGDALRLSSGARLVVRQIGKPFHTDNAVFRAIGSSPLPSDGIFARVARGGEVKEGDRIEIEASGAERGR